MVTPLSILVVAAASDRREVSQAGQAAIAGLIDRWKRELEEETGYTAARWSELMTGYSSAGLTDEEVVIYLAEGLERRGAGGGIDHEKIEVHEVPLGEVTTWLKLRQAKIDFKIFAALFALQELRAIRA